MLIEITNSELYRRASESFSANEAAPEVLVQESTETVYGRPADWRYIRSRLRRLPLPPVLALLSALSVDVERGRKPFDAVVQFRVVERLCDGSRRMRGLLRRLAESPPRIVVHEEQLPILAKMAILNCEAQRWPLNGNQLFLEVLLGYNSLRVAEISARAQDAFERLLFHEVRATATDNEGETSVLLRFGSFVEWSRTEEAKRSRHFIDLDALFNEALGLDYINFAAAVMAFYTNFSGTSRDAAGRRMYSAFLDVQKFVDSVHRPETLNRWFDLVSFSIEEARERLAATPQSTSIASLQDFMRTPLIRIDNVAYCPAIRYLPNLAGSGLIFRLGNYLKQTRGHLASEQLRGFFADFLEAHVSDSLQRASPAVGVSLFRERQFGATNRRSSDVALFSGSNAVFIDVNSKRFNVTHSVINLERESIERDISKMIVEKLTKIADRASDFRAGTLSYPGIDPNSISRIYGLVISPQGFPRLVGLTMTLTKLLPVVPEGLAAWEYFDLSEVEALPELFHGDLDLPELIRAKQADDFGRPRSLTNFLYFRMNKRVRDTRSDELRLAHPWFREILAAARAWGFRSEDP